MFQLGHSLARVNHPCLHARPPVSETEGTPSSQEHDEIHGEVLAFFSWRHICRHRIIKLTKWFKRAHAGLARDFLLDFF